MPAVLEAYGLDTRRGGKLMGTMTRNPEAVEPQAPADGIGEFEELCRTIRGERPREVSSARRAPSGARRSPATGKSATRVPTFRRLMSWIAGLMSHNEGNTKRKMKGRNG